MSERALTLLRSASLNEPLVNSLEREDSLFVLTPHTLLYQDEMGARRVTLRDLTRIHSDQDGLLKIETPAGVAISASLLGFDVAAVQSFFSEVRNYTSQAKQTPAPAVAPPAPTTIPTQPNEVTSNHAALKVQPAPVTPTPPQSAPSQAAPPQPVPVPVANPVAVTVAKTVPQPQDKTQVAQASSQTQPSLVTPVIIPESSANKNSTGSSQSQKAPSKKKSSSSNQESDPVAKSANIAATGELGERGEQLGAWVGRLRFMSLVVLVAALGLAFIQFSHQQGLNALWVVIAGGVGAVTLYALTDLIDVVARLAKAADRE